MNQSLFLLMPPLHGGDVLSLAAASISGDHSLVAVSIPAEHSLAAVSILVDHSLVAVSISVELALIPDTGRADAE